MLGRVRRVERACAVALLSVTGCGPAAEDSSTADFTGTDGDADSGSGVVHAWPPSECALDDTPFLQAECLGALRDACRAHAAENDCAAVEPLAFVNGDYSIQCSWAPVVTFVDAMTCEVASTSGRCEAMVDLLGCILPCTAFVDDLEIIQMCGGPLGEWSAVDSEPTPDIGACASNVTPPAPALCDCAPAACAAE